MNETDFAAINKAALAHCPSLLERLLPGGKVQGHEYVCSDLSGGNGGSCSINLNSGKWADFSTDDSGKDLIALVAAIEHVNQYEAAERLAGMAGYSIPAENRTQATAIYAYRNEQGQLLGLVCRFNKAGSNSKGKAEKVFAPFIYTSQGWKWKKIPGPYPLYGLEDLPKLTPNAPIIVIEGEGKADALKGAQMPNAGVLSLYGGSNGASKMDLTPLRGKRVIYWPDNDKPGAKAALAFVEKARGIAASIKIIRPPADAPETWDAGDAVKEGWDCQRFIDWISANRLDPEEFAKLAQERWEIGGNSQQEERPALKIVDIAQFVTMEIPPRKPLLYPVIMEKGHAMIYAARGTGKTYAALSIAWAVASGGEVFGRWKAPEPRRVLLIDGEMPSRSLQERIKAIGHASETDITRPEYLRIISADMQETGIPNLSTEEGQKAIEPFIEETDLIIVDNLATLASYGKSNEAESWLPMQTWLLELRRKGKTALLIHHASKSGDQRGTSSREDILETVISLKRPADYEPKEGARFECHFTKTRGFSGKEAMPFEARLIAENGKQRWITKTIENAELDRLKSLLDEGYSVRDCAQEMGCSTGKIQHMKKKLDSICRDTI